MVYLKGDSEDEIKSVLMMYMMGVLNQFSGYFDTRPAES